MKAIVFFYDSYDIATGIFYSLEEALAEDFVRVVGNEILPFDACSIILEYDKDPDAYALLKKVELMTNQHIFDYAVFSDIADTAIKHASLPQL